MIDLSKCPSGCLEPDSGPDLTTGGFLEPDSGLAGQSGRENRAGRARAGLADGAGVSNDAGRDGGVSVVRGWEGRLGPHKGRLGPAKVRTRAG